MHSTGKETISRSVLFLKQYEEELCGCDSADTIGTNGKQQQAGHALARQFLLPLHSDMTNLHGVSTEEPMAHQWNPPEPGAIKLNTDAAYLADSGVAHAGAIEGISEAVSSPHCPNV